HQLRNYKENPMTLSFTDAVTGKATPIASGKFVNEVETDNRPEWSGADDPIRLPFLDKAGGQLEYIEVLFSPEPGNEKAIKINHGVKFDTAKKKGIREADLLSGFSEKYHVEIPTSGHQFTWVVSSSGAFTRKDQPCWQPAQAGSYINVDAWASNGF